MKILVTGIWHLSTSTAKKYPSSEISGKKILTWISRKFFFGHVQIILKFSKFFFNTEKGINILTTIHFSFRDKGDIVRVGATKITHLSSSGQRPEIFIKTYDFWDDIVATKDQWERPVVEMYFISRVYSEFHVQKMLAKFMSFAINDDWNRWRCQ